VKENLYNKAYEKYTPDWFEDQPKVNQFLYENNRTLIEYFDQYFDQFVKDTGIKLKILDIGCGFGGLSLHLRRLGHEVLGIDISNLAIQGAKEIAQARKLLDDKLEYRVMDITQSEQLGDKFDLIIDSHLLHCLTRDDERAAYFNFIKSHLKPDGKYLLETMTFQKGLRTPIEYTFGEDYILYRNQSENDLPLRIIKTSIDLENEIKSHGLNINYLYFHSELSFQVYPEEPDFPHQHLPHTLRVACTL
jgi:2-polyprenyl-3-methyl-5-hydroxy-6-metoxy-1,4-benzoquinol methylase